MQQSGDLPNQERSHQRGEDPQHLQKYGVSAFEIFRVAVKILVWRLQWAPGSLKLSGALYKLFF